MPETNNINEVYPDAILNISRETASVFQLKRRFERKPSMLNLTPLFQREQVWNLKQKSELVESIIMGIPIPVFYVKEQDDGVYVVVDGKQRLTTLFEFINNEFALGKLSILKNYKGKHFSELSPLDQNKIEDCTLTINVIKAPTSDRVMFDLFDRVNRGGTRITNQEMRNALYQGNATRLIDRLSKMDVFKYVTEGGASPKHMKDRLIVLRFIAFYMWQQQISRDVDSGALLDYRSNIEDFLGKTMSFLNSLDPQDRLLTKLEDVFVRSMVNAAEYIFPLGGFRLSADGSHRRLRPLNMSFLESFCYLISQHNFSSDEEAREVYFRLLNNRDYISSITVSIDSRSQVEKRYNAISEVLTSLT